MSFTACLGLRAFYKTAKFVKILSEAKGDHNEYTSFSVLHMQPPNAVTFNPANAKPYRLPITLPLTTFTRVLVTLLGVMAIIGWLVFFALGERGDSSLTRPLAILRFAMWIPQFPFALIGKFLFVAS